MALQFSQVFPIVKLISEPSNLISYSTKFLQSKTLAFANSFFWQLDMNRSKIEKQKEGIQTTKNEMETNSTAIEEIIQKKESVAGEQLRELQEKESNISKLLVQENTQFQNKVKGLESDKKSLKDLEKQAKQLTQKRSLLMSEAHQAPRSILLLVPQKRQTESKLGPHHPEHKHRLGEKSIKQQRIHELNKTNSNSTNSDKTNWPLDI